ncbi:MAG: AroM family protein [Vicinamibacterales bacterium]
MTAKLGTITIGQAPRPDVTPILDQHVAAAIPRVHVGVLDRLSRDEITAGFAPRGRDAARMVTRLADGSSVEVDAAAIEAGVQRRLTELEDAGCTVVVVLCTGVFRGLRSRKAWLIEPDRILPALVAGMVGARRVGMISPIAIAPDAARRKWAALQIPPMQAVASPYVAGDSGVEAAALELKRAGADLLLLDCIGFVDRHRTAAHRASGLPVLQASDLVARVTGACLAEDV